MERKIGETFEYEGKKLKVTEIARGCDGCFFDGKCFLSDEAGQCESVNRTDRKNVIFVEVQEQQTEEPKERKIGETFEFEGHKLKVVADTDGRKCPKCFFYSRDCSLTRDVTGYCLKEKRIDRKGVTFVEAKDEQPQEQAEQPQKEQPKLNLCEILKHCPKGEKFWSPMFGDVVYYGIIKGEVGVTVASGVMMIINADGTLTINFVTSPEIMLYPSRGQRDWSKVKYEPKKERFDPKTLKAFDKILIYSCGHWECSFFNRLLIQSTGKIGRVLTSCGSSNTYCVPYNDDTKHLVGTTDEAPEFYRYWGGLSMLKRKEHQALLNLVLLHWVISLHKLTKNCKHLRNCIRIMCQESKIGTLMWIKLLMVK